MEPIQTQSEIPVSGTQKKWNPSCCRRISRVGEDSGLVDDSPGSGNQSGRVELRGGTGGGMRVWLPGSKVDFDPPSSTESLFFPNILNNFPSGEQILICAFPESAIKILWFLSMVIPTGDMRAGTLAEERKVRLGQQMRKGWVFQDVTSGATFLVSEGLKS